MSDDSVDAAAEAEPGRAAKDLDNEEIKQAAEQGDPREPQGTPPEGRHPGAQDWRPVDPPPEEEAEEAGD